MSDNTNTLGMAPTGVPLLLGRSFICFKPVIDETINVTHKGELLDFNRDCLVVILGVTDDCDERDKEKNPIGMLTVNDRRSKATVLKCLGMLGW